MGKNYSCMVKTNGENILNGILATCNSNETTWPDEWERGKWDKVWDDWDNWDNWGNVSP